MQLDLQRRRVFAGQLGRPFGRHRDPLLAPEIKSASLLAKLDPVGNRKFFCRFALPVRRTKRGQMGLVQVAYSHPGSLAGQSKISVKQFFS